MSLTSQNLHITISEDDNVTINNGKVIFHEFSQAVININYVPTVARAKTAFSVEDGDTIVQCSFRNDVIPNNSMSKVLFTGGYANLLVQSQVGRTGNIARGIVGAINRRPTGNFRIKVKLYTSEVPSGQPTLLVDELEIEGTVKRLFNDDLLVDVTQDGNKLNYSIQLSNNDSLDSSPFLYGYKISGIGNGISLKKGSTTVRNGDIFQVSNSVSGGVLELKSSGSNGGAVDFDVTAVDVDKKDRDSNVHVGVFSFENIDPVVSFPNIVDYVAADPSANPPVVGVTKVVGFQPWQTVNGVETLQTGLPSATSNTPPVASSGFVQSIWSASARSDFEGKQEEGKVKFSFDPEALPVTSSIFNWVVTGHNLIGALDNIVKVNGSSMVNGVVSGSAVFSKTNPDIILTIASELYKSGTLSISCSVKHNFLEQEVGSAVNLRLIKNDPKAGAYDKRVYLFDNTLNYTVDPTFDDRASWNSQSNPVDESGDSIISKLISDSSATKFNLNFADANSVTDQQFVGSNGNLGVRIKWSTLVATLPSSTVAEINSLISATNAKLKIVVNPNTYSKLSDQNRAGSLFVNDATGTVNVTTFSSGSAGSFTKTVTRYNVSASGTRTNPSVLSEEQVNSNTAVADVYTYNLADNVMSIKPNGFYGRIRMHYRITESANDSTESYNWGNSSIYVMPRANPVITEYQRQLEVFDDNGVSVSLSDTNRTAFSMADFIRYKVSIKNGSTTDYDYSNQTQSVDSESGSLTAESNPKITIYLKKNQKLRIKYEDAVPNLKINNRAQSQNSANGIIKFDSGNSEFNLLANGYDSLDWLNGMSVGVFELEPPINGGGNYESWITMKFTSVLTPVADAMTAHDTISIYDNDDTVVKNLTANQFSILNVPVIKGFEVSRSCSLITGVQENVNANPSIDTMGSLNVATCTAVVIRNIGNTTINVNVNDVNLGQSGNQALYLSANASNVPIAVGKAKVFIRIMYSPEAWEPMAVDY